MNTHRSGEGRDFIYLRQRRAVVGREWTECDDANLAKCAQQGWTAAKTGKALGRTRASCLSRAARIGLSFAGQRTKAACCPSCGRELRRRSTSNSVEKNSLVAHGKAAHSIGAGSTTGDPA